MVGGWVGIRKVLNVIPGYEGGWVGGMVGGWVGIRKVLIVIPGYSKY